MQRISHNLASRLVGSAVALVIVACGEPIVQPGFQEETSLTATDSAVVLAALANRGQASGPQLVGGVLGDAMVMSAAADSFEVRLVERDCASPTNTVTVVSPVILELSTTMCQEAAPSPSPPPPPPCVPLPPPFPNQCPPDPPPPPEPDTTTTSWTLVGPFSAGSGIVLDFETGVEGATGAMQITGSFPQWTATFEDGFDSDFNDFVLQVTAFLPPGTDSLVVAIELSRTEVTPVLDRLFNASTQFWSEPAALQRNDTVQVTITARLEPSGVPASGASFALSTEGVGGTGGHVHTSDPRPPGNLFELGDSIFIKQVVTDQLSGTLASDGSWTGVLRSSGLSGLESLSVTVTADGVSADAADTLTVRWPGLVAMPRNGTDYTFTGQVPANSPGQRHGNINHFVHSAFPAELIDFFSAVRAAEPTQPLFGITDISLEWGGLHDVDTSPWRNPHKRHRIGLNADIGFSSIPKAVHRTTFVSICDDRPSLNCEDHGNHFHVTFQGGSP